ncbi:MAG: tryptophan synthase subunit alpha [Actinobacteria bacterium]|nr:MAG: tryptophan synthase subunit alpha [Actinomycetota bacterium]
MMSSGRTEGQARAVSPAEGLRAAFAEGRTALIPYLTAGYPTLEGAYEVGEAYLEAGADVVEIGVPFSDPLADGPTIQNTTNRALENGADLGYCFEFASRFSGRAPVVLLVYYNNIFARGAEEFLSEAAGTGVSGLVIPDLPIDEAVAFREMAGEKGVAICPLVAPTTRDARLEKAAEAASGFVYCVSVAGVTGAREVLPQGAVELLRRVRQKFSVPAALGFGISTPEAAVEAAEAGAQGVIVGSKLMQIVADGGPEAAGAWLRELRAALDRGAGTEG